MKNINFSKAFWAGVFGTSVLTVFTMVQPLFGFPPMDIPKMLAMFLGSPPLVGWFVHFFIGITLAFIYAFFSNRLPFSGWKQGAFFGLFPWLAAQLIVMPVMGMPIFSGSLIMATASLIGHLIYGSAIGGVYSCETSCPTEPQSSCDTSCSTEA